MQWMLCCVRSLCAVCTTSLIRKIDRALFTFWLYIIVPQALCNSHIQCILLLFYFLSFVGWYVHFAVVRSFVCLACWFTLSLARSRLLALCDQNTKIECAIFFCIFLWKYDFRLYYMKLSMQMHTTHNNLNLFTHNHIFRLRYFCRIHYTHITFLLHHFSSYIYLVLRFFPLRSMSVSFVLSVSFHLFHRYFHIFRFSHFQNKIIIKSNGLTGWLTDWLWPYNASRSNPQQNVQRTNWKLTDFNFVDCDLYVRK